MPVLGFETFQNANNKIIIQTLSHNAYMKTLYYYYHLFYKNIFKDNESYFTARLALSASEFFFVLSIIDISSAYFFCWSLNEYYMYGIAIIIYASNTFIFFNAEETKKIEKSKPTFFKSHKLSIAITWLFLLIATSSMFWLEYVVQDIMSNCK